MKQSVLTLEFKLKKINWHITMILAQPQVATCEKSKH
jgi:hypothetical protein